jgi:hypothetical protein
MSSYFIETWRKAGGNCSIEIFCLPVVRFDNQAVTIEVLGGNLPLTLLSRAGQQRFRRFMILSFRGEEYEKTNCRFATGSSSTCNVRYGEFAGAKWRR